MEASTSACTPTVRARTFSEQPPGEGTLYFQVIDLGRQYYVWVGVGTPKLSNLHLGIQSHTDKVPAVATLIQGSCASEGAALAQRLSLKLNKPVLCSCNLPQNTPILQAIAERRLLQELKEMEGPTEGST